MLSFLTKNYDETVSFAASFAKNLEPGTVIALDGPLGSGKTAFVTGLVKGLGGTDRVTSPTFTIVHEYINDIKIPVFYFDELIPPENI